VIISSEGDIPQYLHAVEIEDELPLPRCGNGTSRQLTAHSA